MAFYNNRNIKTIEWMQQMSEFVQNLHLIWVPFPHWPRSSSQPASERRYGPYWRFKGNTRDSEITDCIPTISNSILFRIQVEINLWEICLKYISCFCFVQAPSNCTQVMSEWNAHGISFKRKWMTDDESIHIDNGWRWANWCSIGSVAAIVLFERLCHSKHWCCDALVGDWRCLRSSGGEGRFWIFLGGDWSGGFIESSDQLPISDRTAIDCKQCEWNARPTVRKNVNEIFGLLASAVQTPSNVTVHRYRTRCRYCSRKNSNRQTATCAMAVAKSMA